MAGTNDAFAVSATAVAVCGTVVGVEAVVGIADAAQANRSPQAPALDAESAVFQGIFDWHGEGVTEGEGHSEDEGEKQVDGELHLHRRGCGSIRMTTT